jgi:copper chaperone CopZ
MRIQVTIEGMIAVHAKHAVFTALAAVDGITHADVELGRAVLEHDGRATEVAIRAAVAAAGFEVSACTALPSTLPLL